MSKVNDNSGAEVEQRLEDNNKDELYDVDLIYEEFGFPTPVISFNLSESSFLYTLLMSCMLDCERTLSSEYSGDAVRNDAQLMHKEASRLMHRIRDVQKELEDYIYPRKITDYFHRKKEEEKNE